MTKKFYDIKPNEQRTIRNVPLSVTRASEDEKNRYIEPEYVPKKRKIEGVKRVKSNPLANHVDMEDLDVHHDDEESFEVWNKTRRFKYLWAIAFILLIALVYSACTWFSSATITVAPVKYPITIRNTKVTLKDIKNELVEFDIEVSSTTGAGGFIDSNSKASGTIVLYNSFSSSAIKIPAGTALIAPNSLIYKTVSAVTIPGFTLKSGKNIPGSVTVKVEGEKPGSEYNAKFTDFSVQNYKGTAKYEKVYGRSKTEITGGTIGKIPKISNESLNSLIAELKNAVASSSQVKLEEKIKNISPDMVYVPKLMYVLSQEPVQEVSPDGKKISATIRARGVVVLLDRKSLSEQLLKENMPQIQNLGSRVTFYIDTSTLQASMQFDLDMDSIKKNHVYVFFSGETYATSAIDEHMLASAVSGLTKAQALKVIPDLIESENSKIVTSPWWLDRLPLNKGKIKVISQ